MKKIIIVLFLFALAINMLNKKEDIVLPKETIRFRIIANSNSEIDETIKKKIKKEIQQQVFNHMDLNNLSNADKSIKSNIQKIEKIVDNYNLAYNISYGKNYFPQKSYKGVIFPKGDYDSLVIRLGNGLGDNWWCILFPPLCLLDAEEKEFDEVEYKFFTKEILKKVTH